MTRTSSKKFLSRVGSHTRELVSREIVYPDRRLTQINIATSCTGRSAYFPGGCMPVASGENGATMIAAGIRETCTAVACTHVQHTSSRDQGRERGEKKERERAKGREREKGRSTKWIACLHFFLHLAHHRSAILRRPELTRAHPTDSPYSALCNTFLRGPAVPFNASWTEGAREDARFP